MKDEYVNDEKNVMVFKSLKSLKVKTVLKIEYSILIKVIITDEDNFESQSNS